jgi:hypothetical protein
MANAGGVHEDAELFDLLAQCVGDGFPLGLGVGLGFLSEDRLQHRRNRVALLGRRMCQRVSHPVNPAPLVVSATIDPLDQSLHADTVEDPARRCAEPLVVVGGEPAHATGPRERANKLDPAQAAVGQRPQELRPKR